MATPMRDSSLDGGHRPRVADSRTTAKAESSNFEYDDNEWDIGIGDLIIDLDADIEKTNEGVAGTAGSMASTGGGGPSAAKKALAVEHSATVDKGLKMKIKRTKPGTKTSEAKHEIVKSNEQAGQQAAQQQGQPGQNVVAQPTIATTQQNGAVDVTPATGTAPVADKTKHTISASAGSAVNTPPGGASKRGSSGHRRDKAKDKHSGGGGGDKASPKPAAAPVQQPGATAGDIVRVGTAAPGPQRPTTPQQQRAAFPATGPGPPAAAQPSGPPAPPPSPSAATAQGSASKPEQTKVAAVVIMPSPSVATAATVSGDDRCGSPPPAKKLKTSNEPKGMLDVCVGTSVGTITEPDCLGPCEPGTSVTLEGIVWHETEGVLVVNVTWRGKTYVGTLLDCTRHDWAPPRFCDSPTSDLDARTPKGRGKRGRAAANATPGNDLSNFTETRSSVHSKLRNGGGKGRRGGANGGGSNSGPASTGTSSPTPFIPPRPEPSSKRKSRSGEEETPVATPTGKKSRVASAPTPPAVPASPPASPVLLECPEPNCSKKYKHINGLKYHQSHAHGSADDDDTKDVTSMSENDESNIEAPSPVTPVKSPEKVIEAPATPQKKEEVVTTPVVPEVISAPGTPRSTPPSPPQVVVPSPELTPAPAPPLVLPIAEQKSVVKPGVLRFGPQEDFAVGAFGASKPPTSSVQVCSGPNLTTVRAVSVTIAPSQPQTESTTFTNQLAQVTMTTQPQIPQATQLPTPTTHQPHLQNALGHQNHTPLPQQQPPVMQPQQQQNKIPQFKVKPTAALMPDDKKDRNKPQNYKKKNRKSPAGSPHPHPQPEQPVFGLDQAGRDEVQSPAYSDISDDAAPVLESEVSDKNKPADKKTEPGQTMPHSMPQYGMYPFYGQPPYLVQQVQDGKPKEGDKTDKIPEKDPKKDGPEYQQKMLPQHYYSYGYVPGYTYNMDPSYGAVSMVPEDKLKEERIKESPSPAEHTNKPAAPIPNPIQVPTPGKVKTEQAKDKHQNENHQILKESIEMKNQMNPYMYSRQPQQQPAHINHHHHQQQQQSQQQREDEMRRYYLYPDQQRRKEQQQPDPPQKTPNKMPPQSPSVKHKEKLPEEKKDKEVKQEGVKPTMETQGPPPPPTSQYAYAIHPSYLQSPHYGALPFDPNHPMYRNMLVPGPYSGSPYLHPHTTIPRYHAPEDLSRPPQGPTKALDLLQHHANQYYTSHKIHELQERAMKSPTPKTSVASASPSSGGGGGGGAPPSGAPPGAPPPGGPVTTQSGGITTTGANGKQTPVDSKESRSPPPQRHVHTHHHTHVGLGYPLYAPPYGAAVLASQQAAAVTVINPYPPK